MIEGYIVAFVATVTAVFVYIWKDKGNFMDLTKEISLLREQSLVSKKKIEEINQRRDSSTETIMKLRVEIEQFQEHMAKIREQLQITSRNQKRLQRMYQDKKIVLYVKEGEEYEKDKSREMWNERAKALAKKMDGFSV